MAALLEYLADSLDRAQARGQRRRLVESRALGGGRIERDGRLMTDFSSNDYLGLATHPVLAERVARWAGREGCGATGSRLVTGTTPAHAALERRIAGWKGTEAALLFQSGWQLNASVLAALLKAAPETLLFADALIHASLHMGAAKSNILFFRHNDLDHLAQLLDEHKAFAGPRIILSESVFSMDGDRADIAGLAAIARAHRAFFYLDEAHATGVLGPDGRGLAAAHAGAADLVMGTFSKAMGSAGAYVAGTRLVMDYLVNRCSGFIYSTAPAPPGLAAIDAALDLVPGMDAERAHLAALGHRLRERLAAARIDTGASTTHIVPAIIGQSAAAMACADALADRGLLAVAIRPPTVPAGTSRLRFALRATHRDEDVDRLADAVAQALQR
jgi:8-amino-7-oxononanoate synthase